MRRLRLRKLASAVAALGLALGLGTAGAPNPAAAIDPCFGYDLCVHVSITQLSTTQNGAGWVTSTPSGIHCQFLAGMPQTGTSTCDWYFHANFVTSIQVSLDAVADQGSTVACKAGQSPGPSCGTITSYTASGSSNRGFDFEHDPVTVTVGNAGLPGGFVYSTPMGIDCGEQYAACSHSWPWGTALSLYAEGDNGGVFVSWSGSCEKNNESCEIGPLFFDITTTANFGFPATPTPKPTPKPSARPAASATPAPGGTAHPTAPAATTIAPSAGPVSTETATASLGTAQEPTPLASIAASAVAVAGTSLPGSSQVPAAAVGPTATFDLTPIVLAIIAGCGLIAIGIIVAAALARRGKSA